MQAAHRPSPPEGFEWPGREWSVALRTLAESRRALLQASIRSPTAAAVDGADGVAGESGEAETNGADTVPTALLAPPVRRGLSVRLPPLAAVATPAAVAQSPPAPLVPLSEGEAPSHRPRHRAASTPRGILRHETRRKRKSKPRRHRKFQSAGGRQLHKAVSFAPATGTTSDASDDSHVSDSGSSWESYSDGSSSDVASANGGSRSAETGESDPAGGVIKR